VVWKDTETAGVPAVSVAYSTRKARPIVARIRTIKPALWGSGGVAHVSRDARLLFIALISMADDEGRFIASPAAILGYAYPHDSIGSTTLRRWLDELVKKRMVFLYRVDGLEYGVVVKFKDHQRIDKPSPSVLPPPPGDLPE